MDVSKAHVSDEKKKLVKELAGLLKEKNTIMLTSIKGLPAAQFQKIKKAISKDVDVRVIKKRALLRAIDESGKKDLKKLKEYVHEDIAVLITSSDAFDLSETLSHNTSPMKAKAGQESPKDIEIQAGPTSLPAGPAVSELGSVGLTVKIQNGKIEILEPRVIAKKGQLINEEMASVMGKLDMTPFEVGFIPLVAFDSQSGAVFTQLNIDKEGTVEEMKSMFAKSRAFAVHIGYISKETIGLLLLKAESHEKALSKLVCESKEEVKEEVKEEAETTAEKNESDNAPKLEETK